MSAIQLHYAPTPGQLMERDIGSASSFAFDELLPEIQKIVASLLDMPTRESLALTTKRAYTEFHDRDHFVSEELSEKCAEFGYDRLLHYIYSSGGPFSRYASIVGAKHGHFRILKLYATVVGIPDKDLLESWSQESMTQCHFQLARKIKQTWPYSRYDLEQVSQLAESGDLQKIEFLYSHSQSDELRAKIWNEHGIELHGHFSTNKVILKAIAYGHLHIVQWGLNQEFKSRNSEHYLKHFTYSGHDGFERKNFEIIKLLFEESVKWPKEHPKILQDIACIGTASGWLECLQFVVEKGRADLLSANASLLFDKWCCTEETKRDRFECLKYLHAALQPQEPLTNESVTIWATKEHLMWLKENGYRVRDLDGCADPEAIGWLIEQGYQVTSKDIKEYAKNGKFQALQKLLDHYTPSDEDCWIIPDVVKEMADDVPQAKVRHYLKVIKLLIEKKITCPDYMLTRRHSWNTKRPAIFQELSELLGLQKDRKAHSQ